MCLTGGLRELSSRDRQSYPRRGRSPAVRTQVIYACREPRKRLVCLTANIPAVYRFWTVEAGSGRREAGGGRREEGRGKREEGREKCGAVRPSRFPPPASRFTRLPG